MVRAHLEETERHGRCRTQPYAELEREHTDGGGRFKLTCRWHSSSRWTKDVTAREAAALVRASSTQLSPRRKAGLPARLPVGSD
ncbi:MULTISPECIES: hypothetical protein [Streptomyces]|uniref:hypothetical protein n=1 Tax=Streptomyces TaxID=1883 RepID=UPI002F90ADA0|nr:hypothetical protein OH736_45785 [Streptomyces sp. NBC_01650]